LAEALQSKARELPGAKISEETHGPRRL